MDKHTPGPWRLHGRYDNFGPTYSLVAANTLIAKVYSEAFGDIEQETANARLIAAAPELLDALRGLLQAIRMSVCEGSGPAQDAACEAIFKATGAPQ